MLCKLVTTFAEVMRKQFPLRRLFQTEKKKVTT